MGVELIRVRPIRISAPISLDTYNPFALRSILLLMETPSVFTFLGYLQELIYSNRGSQVRILYGEQSPLAQLVRAMVLTED